MKKRRLGVTIRMGAGEWVVHAPNLTINMNALDDKRRKEVFDTIMAEF